MIYIIYVFGTISILSLILFIIGIFSGTYENWPMWMFGTWIITMILCGVIYYFYESNQPKFALNKADWNCVESHTVHYTSMMLVGKVMVPQYHTEVICDEYRRVK